MEPALQGHDETSRPWMQRTQEVPDLRDGIAEVRLGFEHVSHLVLARGGQSQAVDLKALGTGLPRVKPERVRCDQSVVVKAHVIQTPRVFAAQSQGAINGSDKHESSIVNEATEHALHARRVLHGARVLRVENEVTRVELA